MEYEKKNGQGVAFNNLKKTDEKQPDIKGNFLSPNGEEMEIAIWRRKSKAGNEFFSLSVQKPFVPHKQEAEDLPLAEEGKPLPF